MAWHKSKQYAWSESIANSANNNSAVSIIPIERKKKEYKRKINIKRQMSEILNDIKIHIAKQEKLNEIL